MSAANSAGGSARPMDTLMAPPRMLPSTVSTHTSTLAPGFLVGVSTTQASRACRVVGISDRERGLFQSGQMPLGSTT
ncbi:MAG: hypothetical protein GX446_10650 [Chthonomonadales bacterium]|nr:hypothetical protein [Chthonomonadales bacterium]